MPLFPPRSSLADGRSAVLGLVPTGAMSDQWNAGIIDDGFGRLNRVVPGVEPTAAQKGLVAGVLDDGSVGWVNPRQPSVPTSIVIGPHKDPPPPKPGEIQWADGHFQGFNGTAWVNLD